MFNKRLIRTDRFLRLAKPFRRMSEVKPGFKHRGIKPYGGSELLQCLVDKLGPHERGAH